MNDYLTINSTRVMKFEHPENGGLFVLHTKLNELVHFRRFVRFDVVLIDWIGYTQDACDAQQRPRQEERESGDVHQSILSLSILVENVRCHFE